MSEVKSGSVCFESLVVRVESEFGSLECLRFFVQFDRVQIIHFCRCVASSLSFAGADMPLVYLCRNCSCSAKFVWRLRQELQCSLVAIS